MCADKIRVGLIGAGANTRLRHIPGLKAQEDVEIVGVANRTAASGERIAAEYDIPSVYDNWLDIIDDDDIDAVCIGTWPYMHAPMTLAALSSDKHVLVEARMAMNSHEARLMLDASRDNPHLVTQIVPAPQSLAVDRTIIDFISDGYLGNLIGIDARVAGGSFPDYDGPLHWRHDRDLSGNNAMTMGIWYEIVMRWVGAATRVAAMSQTVVKHRKDAEGRRRAISIPDHLDILAELAAGGQMHMNVSTVSGFRPASDIWLHGTDGTLRLYSSDGASPGSAALMLEGGRRGDSSMKAIDIPEAKRGSWRVEEEFISAIRGLEPVTHTSFTDGVAYMEFTDAVTLAWQTGETIPLPF